MTYNYLLGWKLEFQIENQQSCSKALGDGGSRLGWDLPVPAAIGVGGRCGMQLLGKWVVGPDSISLVGL